MTVHFTGAGPGAAELLTLRAARLLEGCEVCLYAGTYVSQAMLDLCPPHARLVDTRDLTLDEIVEVMTEADSEGKDVVRLCSGDPAVFSAIAEQARRLDRAGIDWDVTPGVPSFAAAAAALKRELTVPEVGQTVILSRIAHRATAMPPGEELASLGATGATLVLHLAVQRIEQVVAELRPHYGDDCPAAVVAYASQDREVILRGTLGDIAAQVLAAGVRTTAVIIVGKVLTATGFRDSHLYSAGRERPAAPSPPPPPPPSRGR